MDALQLFYSICATSTNGADLELDEKEQSLVSEVLPIVSQELKEICDGKQEEPATYVPVAATQDNFKEIMELFRAMKDAPAEIVEVFPEWFPSRENVIQKLTKIADSIHKDRRNSNISRIVGSSASIVGGSTLLGSAICPPAAVVLVPLSVTAVTIVGLGGVTVFGTAIAELGLLNKKTSEAKRLLEEDRKRFKIMEKWFVHAEEFKKAVDSVIGFSVMKALFRDLKKFSRDFTGTTSFVTELKECIQLICCTDYNFPLRLGINIAAAIITFCVVILWRNRNCLIFECVVLFERVMHGLNVGRELTKGITTMIVRGSTTAVETASPYVSKAILHSVFPGIGMAFDTVNIVFTSVDMYLGSKSKFGKDIMNAAESLNKELEVLKQVYNELKNNQIGDDPYLDDFIS